MNDFSAFGIRHSAFGILALALIVSACGGGGTDDSASGSSSSSGNDQAPATGVAVGGIYSGTVGGQTAGSSASTGFVLIDESGKTALFLSNNASTGIASVRSPYAVVVPTLALTTSASGTYSGAVQEYSDPNAIGTGTSTTPESGTINVTVTPRSNITGTYGATQNQAPNTITSTANVMQEVNVTYEAALYESGSSLSLLAGTYASGYSLGDHGSYPTLSFDRSGNIAGTDAANCVYKGTATILNSKYNLYGVLLANNCDANAVQGLAYYVAATTSQAAYIVFGGYDSSQAFESELDATTN